MNFCGAGRRGLLALSSIVILGPLVSGTGAGAGDLNEVAVELLDLQPPARDWREHMAERIAAGEPLPPLPEGLENLMPQDDASPQEHLRFWQKQTLYVRALKPTAAARRNLLEAVLERPAAIAEVLDFLPQDAATAEKIAAAHNQMPEDSPEAIENRRAVLAWVFEKNGLRRAELLDEAKNVIWMRYEIDDAPLRALFNREPEIAVKICREFCESDDPRLAVLGASRLYRWSSDSGETPSPDRAEEAGLRRGQLQEFAANTEFPERARKMAVETLLDPELPWPDRANWILEHLSRANPGEVSWFNMPIHLDPESWIPRLVALVGGPSRPAHDHAVELLAEFNLENSRVDALRPLLPWLSDPEWSDAPELSRLRVIQSMDRVELPECIPGLLKVVTNENEYELTSAAAALAHYGVKEAIPLLHEALEREADSHHRRLLILAIDDLNGFPGKTVADSIATTLRAYADDEKKRRIDEWYWAIISDEKNRPDISIGWYFIGKDSIGSAAAKQLRERAGKIENQEPEVAEKMRAIAAGTSTVALQRFLAERLETGTLTGDQLLDAFSARKNSDDWYESSEIFQEIAAGKGAAAGFAAVLSGDEDLMKSIAEREGDPKTCVALFAAARLTRDPLPLAPVAKRITADKPLLSRAAALYLQSEDSAEARRLIAEAEELPDGIETTGSRLGWDPGHTTFGHFDWLEKGLREEIGSREGPDEVYGLLTSGYWGGEGHRLIFVKNGKATAYRDYEHGRFGKADLTPEQLERVRDYISKYKADDLPPLDLPIHDGIQMEYVHMTAEGSRAVFMNNPPVSRAGIEQYNETPEGAGIVVYGQLVNLFSELFDDLDLDLGYGNGIEILVPRETATIETVWKEGDDLRVFVNDRIHLPYWSSVKNGTLAGTARKPEDFGPEGLDSLVPDELREPWNTRTIWRAGPRDFLVLSGDYAEEGYGLWLCRKNEKPVRLIKAWCSAEVLSPDGKWCVAAKVLEGNWASPNTVIRFNLETREELPVDLEPADNFHPLAYVEAHRKFLLTRFRDPPAPGIEPTAGPEEPEFHLLDAATGDLQRVSGEFFPFAHTGNRPLQPTGEENIFWAAKPKWSPDRQSTVIGKFNAFTFQFEPVKSVEGFTVESSAMWVDANEGMVYAALNGDLVRFPLE